MALKSKKNYPKINISPPLVYLITKQRLALGLAFHFSFLFVSTFFPYITWIRLYWNYKNTPPNKELFSVMWLASAVQCWIGTLKTCACILTSIELIILISLGGSSTTDGDSAGGHRYLDDGRCWSFLLWWWWRWWLRLQFVTFWPIVSCVGISLFLVYRAFPHILK